MIGFLTVQTLNGLVYSMLLFILALGLSLTFGLMRLVNMAHGSFFLLGGYIGLSTWEFTQNFWIATAAAVLGTALTGLVLERTWLRFFYHRSEYEQVILTFGASLVFSDLAKMIWGNDIRSLSEPALLNGSVQIEGLSFPVYRLALICTGVAFYAFIWLVIERTRVGALVRATVSDRDMVGGLGFDTRLLFAFVFSLGVGFAGFAGILGAPFIGVYPSLDSEVLITTLIVVVVGGLGSIHGAFLASILIGLVETFGKALLPELASFVIFGVMVVTLLVRFTNPLDEEEGLA